MTASGFTDQSESLFCLYVIPTVMQCLAAMVSSPIMAFNFITQQVNNIIIAFVIYSISGFFTNIPVYFFGVILQ